MSNLHTAALIAVINLAAIARLVPERPGYISLFAKPVLLTAEHFFEPAAWSDVGNEAFAVHRVRGLRHLRGPGLFIAGRAGGQRCHSEQQTCKYS